MMEYAPLIARQRACFASGLTRPLAFRRQQLQKLHDAVIHFEAELLAALHADLRKSANEAYMTEIGLVMSEVRHALKRLPAWMKPQRRGLPLLAKPGKGRVVPEPLGVALIVGPWNYPFQLLFSPLVGAIAAGNCVVVKPSELAPHTAAAVAKLISATFPTEYVTVVEGERETAEALLHEKFDAIFFTGSSAVGRVVMTAAAQHLTPVTLELGGKCPAIVCGDAPIDVTARRIAWGKFMNAGQTCVAPDFVMVDRRIRGPLIEGLQRAIREFYGDDPQKSPDYGRIVNRRHFDRLIGYAPSAKHDADDLYIAPTILADVSPTAPIMQDEIFGPILPVVAFDNLDDAIMQLRDRPTPLALYLFAKDCAIHEKIIAGTRSGGVCINDTVTHMIGKQLPFGGLGESGMGTYHGKASFDCFTHSRSVVTRSLMIDPKLRYPPPRFSLEKLKRSYRFLLGD
jgi:aldehyde dehydrogenase (NAD+)